MNIEQITGKTVVNTSGVLAVGSSAAPPEVFPSYLTTHGLGVLSYAEMIQLVGGIYVTLLLCNLLKPYIKSAADWMKNKLNGDMD